MSSLILRFWKVVLLNRPQNAWLTMHLCRNTCLNKSYVTSVNFLNISFHWQFYLQKQSTEVHQSFLRYQENFSIHRRIILYLGKDVRSRDAPAHTRIQVLSRKPSQRLQDTHLLSPQTWHSIINSKGGRSAKDSWRQIEMGRSDKGHYLWMSSFTELIKFDAKAPLGPKRRKGQDGWRGWLLH